MTSKNKSSSNEKKPSVQKKKKQVISLLSEKNEIKINKSIKINNQKL